ncbi:unnamed protein product [Symbiodinium sp. CCMP2592]|nr:unnamed protein product [Symbiodinium sp. CCMP2592]CAE7388023.1 unnamed protein product [Symbiodinium sp. CCMP2592]
MARLGASGKHAQNAERDLQTAIRMYGRSLGCSIDKCKVRTVRMWDPRDNAIISVELEVLFPDTIARAIWQYSPDVFENIFLGPAGPEGAKLFWDNAKRNCPWYPPHIQQSEHAGLMPLSLYGDDVQAYRNSDPGAISAIGWCSDFGRGHEAFLHYMLCTVFSEYCACEHTYEDLMEALLPRFHDMCDADPKKNPWCSRGLRFVFTGVQGDLKWLLSRYGLHNYAKNGCCSLCNAVKNDPDPCKTIACFTAANQFVHVSHENFCAERALHEWPAPMIYGVRLERFLHDVAHSQLLGTGKTLNGSALIFLCESGEFSPNGTFPPRGFYNDNLNAALRVAYVEFKAWVKRSGLRVNQPRFTYSRLNRKNRASHPCLASKAVSGKVISFWLASRCVERSERAGASDVEKLVALCTHAYASMLKKMDEAPLVMTQEQADDLYNVGIRHLQTYARGLALEGSWIAGAFRGLGGSFGKLMPDEFRAEFGEASLWRKQVNDAADHLCRDRARLCPRPGGRRHHHRLFRDAAAAHVTEDEFRAVFGEASLWRKQVNDAADHLCGKAAARATAQAGRWCPDEIDDLVREVWRTSLRPPSHGPLTVGTGRQQTEGHRETPIPAELEVHRLEARNWDTPKARSGSVAAAAGPETSGKGHGWPEEEAEEKGKEEQGSLRSRGHKTHFQEVPGKGNAMEEDETLSSKSSDGTESEAEVPAVAMEAGLLDGDGQGTSPRGHPAERPSEGPAQDATDSAAAANTAAGPPNPFPPTEWIYRIDTECRSGSNLQVIRLPVPGHSTAADVLERVPAGTAKLYANTAEGVTLRQDSAPPVVTTDMLWCIACRVRVPTPEHMQGHLMTASHVIAVSEYLESFKKEG